MSTSRRKLTTQDNTEKTIGWAVHYSVWRDLINFRLLGVNSWPGEAKNALRPGRLIIPSTNEQKHGWALQRMETACEIP